MSPPRWRTRKQLAVAEAGSGGGTCGNCLESIDKAQQVGRFGLAKLARLEREQEEALAFDLVRAEKQFDQPRLIADLHDVADLQREPAARIFARATARGRS